MLRLSPALGVLVLFLALPSCMSQPKSSRAEPAWINNMHRLSAAHLRLLPLAAEGKKFADPSQKEAITEELKAFANTATTIARDNKAPNADPVITFNSNNLANDARQAYAAYQVGDIQWSRFAFNRTSSYCIGCHTRADRGVKDFETSWTTELSALNSAQKIEFLLANRRYKSAYLQSVQLAKDVDFAQRDPRAWTLALEKTLGMVVRVNKDPAQAEELVRPAMANRGAPYYARRDASTWLKNIKEWKAEHEGRKNKDKFTTAVQLVEHAQKAGQRSSSSLIQNLRASGLLHELLENSKSPRYGESLLYAGMVANSLRELNLGFLDQYYYESCIQYSPHSDLAERCFNRLEMSVHEANPFLDLEPEGEWAARARLGELKRLAEVKDVFDDPKWLPRPWEEQP